MTNNLRVLTLRTFILAVAALLAPHLPLPAATAAENAIGVVVMHGKWGSPQRAVNSLAQALSAQGFLVTVPEMPWSGRRLYDIDVAGADAEIDTEILKLRAAGAGKIFLAGHSMGAGYALHYASRAAVDGIAAIAPGHRPESKVYADLLGPNIINSRALAASGKGDEIVSFIDLNSGSRRESFKAKATSFLSYFDPSGPMNMARNVTTLKPGVAVLWMVPTREEQPARDFVVSYYGRLPANPGNRFAEPDSDHLQAPAAAIPQIIDWIRATAARN